MLTGKRAIVAVLLIVGAAVAVPSAWAPTVVEINVTDSWSVDVTYNDTAVEVFLTGITSSLTKSIDGGSESDSDTPGEVEKDTKASDTNAGHAEKLIHARINGVRESNGLRPLDYNSKLAKVAKSHSEDMASKEYFSHTNSAGQTLQERYREEGINCAGGENLFWYGSEAVGPNHLANLAVDSWMESDGHRENILRQQFDQEGIGVVYANGSVYVTQNLC